MIDIVLYILKYILYFVIAFLIYFIYYHVYKPYSQRQYYKKYPNIFFVGDHIPILGDIVFFAKDVNEGRCYYDHQRAAVERIQDNHDFWFEQEGARINLKAISPKAWQEMEQLIPAKVDRLPELIGFGKVLRNSFISERSTTHQMNRRKTFVNSLSTNECSKYIPTMVKVAEERMDSFNETTEYELTYEMYIYTFTVFTRVIFGEDMLDLATKPVKYENKLGQIETKNLREQFLCILKDHLEGMLHPITSFFPSLNKKNLINPFKRNEKNLQYHREALKEVISKVKDEKSVYKVLLKDSTYSEEEVFGDVAAILVAGADTSSHTLAACLYYLKKYPETLEKLRKELKERGIVRDADLSSVLTSEVISEIDYLSYVIKEALRLDPPARETLLYKVYEDVEIWGVKIPANTEIRKPIFPYHWDSKVWHEPHKFIPERFDPESQFYMRPSDGKARGPNAMVPFGNGKRACPGQAFAMMEMKIILACFVSHFEYDVKEELLNKVGIGYAIGTADTLPCKIRKLKE